MTARFDAVVLAGGSTVPRDLDIPGRDAKGIHFAMDFLGQQNRRVAKGGASTQTANPPPGDKEISATGKNVVVIGGGDTGSDCVGTSNRQGAKAITQFELLPKPGAERTVHMPWPSYPMTLKITSSHEEGSERHWAVATKEFVSDEAGNLRALKVVDLEWKVVDGRAASFVEVPDSEREIPCELALLAMGFLHPQHNGMVNDLGVEKDGRGNVAAVEGKYQTSVPNVFAAGDMRRGQSLVVWAISEGRECAKKVDEFLMGSSQLPSKDESSLVMEMML